MIYIYLVLANILAFVLMGIDKYKAVNNRWRIPERVLLVVAFVGGSVGAYAGMFYFHHKTKHAKFLILLPAFLIIHVLVFLFWKGDFPVLDYMQAIY